MSEHQIIPIQPDRAYTRNVGPTPGMSPWGQAFGGSPYPGLGGYPAPYAQQTPSSAGGGLNLSQFKAILDRMGGIDGILGTVAKVQKIVQSLQQMSPLLKLVMNSFLGGAKAKASDAGSNPDGPAGRSKRRRRSTARGKRTPPRRRQTRSRR